MSDFRPLGPPIPKPAAAPKPDEYERFIGSHGDRLMRNKRTGQIETAPPRKIPEPEVTEVEVVTIIATRRWDAMTKCLRRQEADGFPLNEFGVM
jgi:hypothetical protein